VNNVINLSQTGHSYQFDSFMQQVFSSIKWNLIITRWISHNKI